MGKARKATKVGEISEARLVEKRMWIMRVKEVEGIGEAREMEGVKPLDEVEGTEAP